MYHKKLPTKERLRELLEFQSETGYFKRLISNSNRIKVGDIVGITPDSEGYGRISIDGERYKTHVLVWVYHYGNIPDGMEIDHIDRNRINNKLENLRLVYPYQNGGNRSLSSRNSSGYKGVSFHKRDERWAANIGQNGESVFLGYFSSAEEAAMAYNKAAIAYFGKDYANLNIIA